MNKKSFWIQHKRLHQIYQESIFYTPIHTIFLCYYLIKIKSLSICEYINSIPRALGLWDKKFEKLRRFKNKYEGKRCFITCTGPSLTISDLEMLKDEYVFGMNSICLIHDKTEWKPDFFGIQDTNVFEKVKDKLLTTDNGIVFAPYSYKKSYNTPDDWVYWHMCGRYHIFEMIYTGKYFTRFSSNCYAKVYDGYSIAYSILELVMYMGFDEIYLLGADCSYLGKQQHFIETGNYDPQFTEATQKLFTSYGKAKGYADKHGIEIFNATRGGCLEMFPRVQLEDVINNSKKNKIS